MDKSQSRGALSGPILSLLLMAAGGYLTLRAIEIGTLAAIGERTQSLILHVSRHSSTRGGPRYSVYYEFTTPDGAQYGGTAGGFSREPRPYHSLPIFYMPGLPELNRAATTPAATVLIIALFLIPGAALLGYGTVSALRAFRPAPCAPQPRPGLETVPPNGVLRGLGLAALGFLLGFASYAVDRRYVFADPPSARPAPAEPAGSPGFAFGNLHVSGQFAWDGGDWLYVAGFEDRRLSRARLDGSEKSILLNAPVRNLNLVGDQLYFLQFIPSGGEQIYRLPVAGGKPRRVLKTSAQDLWVIGDWLYYTREHDDCKVYRARLNGSHAEKLHNDPSLSVNVTPEWIYYINTAFRNRIFRMRLNGADREKLSDDWADELLAAGPWLFYRHGGDENRLYRMALDGSARGQFLDVDARAMNTDGTWLYFCNFADNARLYRVRLEGGSPERIVDKSCLDPHIIGEWLYVGLGELLDLTTYRMRIDTGDGRPGPLEPWPAP